MRPREQFLVGCGPLVVLLFLLSTAPAGAHPTEGGVGVGIDERLGQFVPLDLDLRDDSGAMVRLDGLLTVPTFLILENYSCENACGLLITGVAGVLADIPAEPGKDFQVLSISIDDSETPEVAREAKRLALEQIGAPFPPDAWRFLTADEESIHRITDAVGYRFRRASDHFDHPLALIVLSPSGKIVRYIYGTEYLPVEMKMSILEASSGSIGPTVGKVLHLCFRYDPESDTYVFNILQVTALTTFAVALAFIAYLVISGRRRRASKGVDGE